VPIEHVTLKFPITPEYLSVSVVQVVELLLVLIVTFVANNELNDMARTAIKTKRKSLFIIL